jgi:hypothetical protein
VLGFLLLVSLAAAAESKAVRVLFLGNSYLFGSGSSSRFFRPSTVKDLNQANIGGVPALFKSFTQAAGLAYDAHLELASGQGFDYHLAKVRTHWSTVGLGGDAVVQPARPGQAR